MRKAQVLIARKIAKWSVSAVSKSPAIANSNWTARQMKRHYPDANVEVIYHGGQTIIDSKSPKYRKHSEREENIVIVGRVTPMKKIERAIEIVDTLRNSKKNLGLIIIGNGIGPYAKSIENQIAARPYVKWFKNLTRAEMEDIIVCQKWGLHCADHEHYGLAAIELQRLGCITLVPNNGGQVEVVANSFMRYETVSQAVDKFTSLMNNPVQTESLFRDLPSNLIDHTTNQFENRLDRKVISLFDKQFDNSKSQN